MKDSIRYCSGYYKSFNPYVKEGSFIYYYSNKGERFSEGSYELDEKSGIWKTYYLTGELWYQGQYILGKSNGEFIGYYKTGAIKRKAVYVDGVFQEGNCFTKTGEDTTYYDLYIYPVFRKGDDDLIRYFKKNLKYPKDAMKHKLEGKIYVQFIVKKDGSIDDVKIIPGRSSYYMFNEAAVECIKAMPKWSPGYIDGEVSEIKKVIPVSFKLNK